MTNLLEKGVLNTEGGDNSNENDENTEEGIIKIIKKAISQAPANIDNELKGGSRNPWIACYGSTLSVIFAYFQILEGLFPKEFEEQYKQANANLQALLKRQAYVRDKYLVNTPEEIKTELLSKLDIFKEE
ncbi:MAG: hypothetical protein ABI430_00875 [Candidatus Taylorbacteria bacterium]